MEGLSLKDRYKILKRCIKLIVDPKLDHLTIMWRNPGKETLTHTFFKETDSTRADDVVLELFSRVIGKREDMETLNKAAANLLLKAVDTYTKHNNIPRASLVVMAEPIKRREDLEVVSETETGKSLLPES